MAYDRQKLYRLLALNRQSSVQIYEQGMLARKVVSEIYLLIFGEYPRACTMRDHWLSTARKIEIILGAKMVSQIIFFFVTHLSVSRCSFIYMQATR